MRVRIALFASLSVVALTMIAGCSSVTETSFEQARSAAVKAEEMVQRQLPSSAVIKVNNRPGTIGCGNGLAAGDGRQYVGTRWVYVSSDFDRAKWIRSLATVGQGGWKVVLKTYGSGPEAELTARSGIMVTAVQDEDDKQPLIIIGSYSVCGR